MSWRHASCLADRDPDADEHELKKLVAAPHKATAALHTVAVSAIMVTRLPRSAQRASGMPVTA